MKASIRKWIIAVIMALILLTVLGFYEHYELMKSIDQFYFHDHPVRPNSN